MGEIIILAYELLTELIPFVIAFALVKRFERKKGKRFKKKDISVRLVFAVYILAVLNITGTGTLWELVRLKITEISSTELRQLNLIPFSNGIDVLTILNVLMLEPFGFMLPMLGKKNRRMPQTAVNGFLFSMIIEISQLMNNRCTDIDDLIANTFGAVIGYLIYMIFAKKFKLKPVKENYIAYEPMLYILVMILGRFLLFNEYGAAKLVFQF